MPSELERILNTARTLLAQTIIAANEAAAAAASAMDKADLDSPAFTGSPTAPTAAAGTNSDILATTAYLDSKLGQTNGIATLNSSGRVPSTQLPAAIDYQGVWDADANSPALSDGSGSQGQFYIVSVAGTTSLDGEASWDVGDWAIFDTGVWERVPAFQTDPTNLPLTALADQADDTILGNNSGGVGPPLALTPTQITAMLDDMVGDSGAGGTAGLVPAPGAGDAAALKYLRADGTWAAVTVDLSGYALLDSPAFVNTPTAPTAAADNDSTQIATTGFVIGQAGDATPLIDGTAAAGTSERYARQDHKHPTDTTRAPLASPALTGTPTAPTQTPGDNSTKVATTAYADAAVAAAASGFQVGDVMPTFNPTAPSGWVMMDDGSIGDAGSGATNRANADTEDLYTILWNNVIDTWAPVAGGRGGSAAADFAAGKALTIPRALGRAMAAAGSGSGLTARALGEFLGEEDHALIEAENGPHAHAQRHSNNGGTATASWSGFAVGITDDGGDYNPASGALTDANDTASSGSGTPHNTMQPTFHVHFRIKL